MPQQVSDEFLKQILVIEPGSRLHLLVAMLYDTWYDDLTDERISELIRHVESFRWLNASAERVDR